MDFQDSNIIQARRLQTIPGIGPIAAMAVEAFALPRCTFKRFRDFAPWLRLVPVRHVKGGDPRPNAGPPEGRVFRL
ncbi:transposase [Devosia enhydra]|uniref:transposase n=1 Tax=Devosia enhydra TaxID=665118 RepID=UPI000931557F